MCSLLRNIIRADVASNINHGKRGALGDILRPGQKRPIHRPADTRQSRPHPHEDNPSKEIAIDRLNLKREFEGALRG